MRSKKTLVAFRLTDLCRDELQEALDLQRRLDSLDGQEWQAKYRDRTDIVHQAVSYFLSHLQGRVVWHNALKLIGQSADEETAPASDKPLSLAGKRIPRPRGTAKSRLAKKRNG